ncbi:homeobox-leucine zipper protein HAT14-like [Typha latifolia]|uniref:homeobox-leucine zipper protein HAT14-like n=1 Tax=Typha latifolia TaxID=4733 RepID=UPI003C2C91E3
MGEEDHCNIGLALGIGLGGGGGEFNLSRRRHAEAEAKPPVQFDVLFPFQVEEGKEQVQSKSTEDDDNGGTRKKLRLNKEQSSLLEDCFRTQHTLSPAQKHDIARKLNLKPRQVEVWFQNRRARTKLKQIEVDCEFLRRCCESLTDENRRLKRELTELQSARPGVPAYYVEIQKAAMVSICPTCEKAAMDDVKSVKDWSINPRKDYKLC